MQTIPLKDLEYDLDHKGLCRAPAGLLSLTGWLAGFPNAAPLIRLRIDSANIFECRAGKPRPDVAAAHPALLGAEFCGFALETYLPAGFLIGTLEYHLEASERWTPFHTFSIIADVSPLIMQLECASPPDEAGSDWYLHGWCFHPQSQITILSVQFGQTKTTLSHAATRPDVAAAFPEVPLAGTSGFSGHLRLTSGHGPVQLIARLATGAIVRQLIVPELHIADPELLKANRAVQKIRAKKIQFSTHDQPEVSIIVPIYNQLDHTLGCLESLVRHSSTTTFEVILIDDKSEAHVPEILSQIRGLHLSVNEKNQGFLLSCNRGAVEGKGGYLLFLNNDTEVTAGWLDAMMKVLRDRPKAGLVGAKLIYPDGTLQEAGGLISEDGWVGITGGAMIQRDQNIIIYDKRTIVQAPVC